MSLSEANTKSKPWPEILSQLEALVVAGNLKDSQIFFNTINPKHIPRSWAFQLAELACRIQYPIYALKALHRVVNPENSFAKPASDREQMIYASALLKLGATAEAVAILDSLDTQVLPEVLFYKAMSCFHQWNYLESIPYLQEFIKSDKTSSYRRLVAQMNLAAACVYICDWNSVRPILVEIKSHCEAGHFNLLLGNCYELMAQVDFFQGRYDEALISLVEAKNLLKDQAGFYSMFIDKWTVICHCFKTRNPDNLEKLQLFRNEASKSSHWDTVRECDLFEAILTEDNQLIRKIIMGTPSENYRQRVRRLYGKSVKSNGQYLLNLGQSEVQGLQIFDPYRKQSDDSALYKKPQLLSLFDALTLDFYKPSNIGLLFQKIYPDEKFNPFTSPPRVLQLLKRLNSWFIEQDCTLRVSFKKSEFSLKSDSPIAVCIQRGIKLSVNDGKLSDLKLHFNDKTFSAVLVSEKMGISNTSAKRLIQQAIGNGKVMAMGRGRGTLYRFVPRKRLKAAA